MRHYTSYFYTITDRLVILWFKAFFLVDSQELSVQILNSNLIVDFEGLQNLKANSFIQSSKLKNNKLLPNSMCYNYINPLHTHIETFDSKYKMFNDGKKKKEYKMVIEEELIELGFLYK